MAVLSATFKAIDEMSAVMDRIADSGASAIDRWEAAGTAISDSFEQAGESTAQVAHLLGSTTDSVDELSAALDNQSRVSEEAARALDQVGEGAQNAGAESEKFGTASVGAVNALGQALTAAGIAKLVYEIADAFMEAADIAMAFESSLAKVSTLADTTETTMGEISSAITALSGEMGVAATDIAEATYQAISGSVDTAYAVDFVAEATMLAKGGFTDAATAVDVLTTAVNAYSLSIDEVEQVSSMLITTQNLGKTSVAELASGVGKVIPIAAAYNVEMDNLSAAYAVLTKGGIETANATTYMRAMLGELGDTSSTVSDILYEETGMAFAQLMDEGNSLADVLDVLCASLDNDATAFANLWGSSVAGLGALSLMKDGSEEFNETLVAMQESSGAVSDAFETMAGTTEASKSRMEVAQQNMAATFGSVLTPALDKLYEAGAGAFMWIGDFIDDHPAFTAAVTTGATVLGVATLAVKGYSAATAIATAATTLFGASVSAAVWPMTLAVAGVAALGAGIAVLANRANSLEDEYESLTATSKQHYRQLEELNAEYDRTVDLLGETDYAAQRLRWEIDELEQTFESSRMTMEEFAAQNAALIESHDRMVESYRNSIDEIDTEAAKTVALIDRLYDLGSASGDAGVAQQEMSAIIDRLNEQIPDLSLSYDDMTGSLEGSIAAVRELAQVESDQQRRLAEFETYSEAIAQRADILTQLAEAEADLAIVQTAYDDANQGDRFWDVDHVRTHFKSQESKTERLRQIFDETNRIIEETEASWEAATRAQEEAIRSIDAYPDAVAHAARLVHGDLLTIVEAYDQVYEASYKSIDGVIGLFDTMTTASDLSTQSMLDSFQSQMDYLELYSENLSKAAEYGLDEGLIASLNDGSEKSAGYLNALVEEMERLGAAADGMSGEAEVFIESFNASFLEVEDAKAGFAHTVAEIETEFGKALDNMQKDMLEAVDNMSLGAEAADAAQETIEKYIEGIRSMTGEAHSAAVGVAHAVQVGLGGEGVSTVGLSVPGFATGTLDAPDVFIAGEEGPELIVGAGGSRVFTANETARILGEPRIIAPPPAELSSGDSGEPSRHSGPQEKRITLEISGSGAIQVDGGSDREGIVELMVENIRPILMNVLQQDVFEEGDLSYDF